MIRNIFKGKHCFFVLTDDFMVMIMGRIIKRREGRIPHGRSVVTYGGSAEDQSTGGFSLYISQGHVNLPDFTHQKRAPNQPPEVLSLREN